MSRDIVEKVEERRVDEQSRGGGEVEGDMNSGEGKGKKRTGEME